MKRIAKAVAALVTALLLVAIAWLTVAPPPLLRVGSGYAAKIVCSNVFVAGGDADQVLRTDVQAPGNPLLRLIRVDVDRDSGVVTAGLLGVFARNRAVYREGLGCASLPDGDVARAKGVHVARTPVFPRDDRAPWPAGNSVGDAIDPAVSAILARDALTGPGMRAVVVVHGGHIVGERYGPGFTVATPLVGWSMTKTVTGALVGTALGRFDGGLGTAALRPDWGGARRRITLADLMGMASGLGFNEEYGSLSDVNQMLFLEPDMARFAAGRPLVAAPGTRWSYSSGTTVMLARLLQDRFPDRAEALAWPRRALFGPLGMTSAVMETDESGTFVGSSYLYATARDWARFGQFLLRDGVWNGRRLLPAGYVAWMHRPSLPSAGRYGRGQVWIEGPAGFDHLPKDSYWLRGHDGQTITVIPSRDLVVVRLGLTPKTVDYSAAGLVSALLRAQDRSPGDAAGQRLRPTRFSVDR